MSRVFLLLSVLVISTKAFSQTTEAIVEITPATYDYCKAHDFTPFLTTHEKYGNTGVFDDTYGRLQIHFETIVRDETHQCRYYVTGATRHMKMVTPFKGFVMITDVKRLNGTLEDMLKNMPGQSDEDNRIADGLEAGPYVLVSGVYDLREDSTKKYSGVLSGSITFALRERPDGKLSSDWNRVSNNYYRNFIYKGTWTSYNGEMSAKSAWADGRIPVGDGVDVGQTEFTIAPKYEKGGWKKDANGNFIDNPEYWWRLK